MRSSIQTTMENKGQYDMKTSVYRQVTATSGEGFSRMKTLENRHTANDKTEDIDGVSS